MTASGLAELVAPAYFTAPDYAQTLGPEVGELAAIAGFPPDPEQQLVLDAMFGLDKRGRFTAFEVANICCRQNMKTGLMKQAAIGKVFLMERPLFVWSAHEFSTAQEAFRDLLVLIESTPTLERQVRKVHRAAGAEGVELKGGQRIKFKARTKAGGRGLTGDDVGLDEAFALQPDHLGALLPTLSTRPDPQVFYASSAGLPQSGVLRSIRDRGRKGSPRLVYAEWCDEGPCVEPNCSHDFGVHEGCRYDEPEAWSAANPQAGRRISLDYIAAERAALPAAEFGRERLGRWDEPGAGDPIWSMQAWAECHTDAEPSSPEAIGLAVSYDRGWASLGAFGNGHLGAVRRERGTAWVVAEAARLAREYDIPVVIDERGPASSLVEALREAGVEPTLTGTADYTDACADLADAVAAHAVTHGTYPDLESAVTSATIRSVGDRFAWARKGGDITMLEAVTLARWAAINRETTPTAMFV